MSAPPEPRLAAVPVELIDLRRRIDVRLAEVLDAEHSRWSSFDGLLDEPISRLRAFSTNGGKRLRPAFCHLGHIAAGGDPGNTGVLDAGAALELLHVFALIHDDVMDGSSLRRGEPTIHQHFGDRHAVSDWIGESRRFGEGVAVLVGDLALILADSLLSAAGPTAWSIYNELRIELVMGQLLDIVSAASPLQDPEISQKISLFKSAKYTVERPLHLGAALAGRLDECAEAFTGFGLPVGEAFQLRDDVLGAFGDESKLGKPVGGDFRENKPTQLVLHAQAVAQDQHLSPALEVLAHLGDPDLTPAQIVAIQEVIEATGGRAAVESRIDSLLSQAVDALDSVDLERDAQDQLVGLALYCAHRDR